MAFDNKVALLPITCFLLLPGCMIDSENTPDDLEKGSEQVTAQAQALSDDDDRNIVGTDDRKDAYEVSDYQASVLRSYTVGLVNNRRIQPGPGSSKRIDSYGPMSNARFRYVGWKKGDPRIRVCRNVKFAKQQRAPGCSATLITSTVVATAGHCVPKKRSEWKEWCENNSAVFDFAYLTQSYNPSLVDRNDVYGCKRILLAKKEGRSTSNHKDWAFIELQRPVIGHTPATIVPRGEEPKIGARTIAMGHPVSLPAKYDDGGRFTGKVGNFEFTSTLDTFGGSSGAGVYDSAHRLIGIHWGSAADFIKSSEIVDGERRECLRHNVLAQNSKNGSGHMRIHSALADYCKSFSYLSPRLCEQQRDACAPCESDGDCGFEGKCSTYNASGFGRCEIMCRHDGQCPQRFSCKDNTCVPATTDYCVDRSTIAELDACGATTSAPRLCRRGTECLRGRCESPNLGSSGASCAQARRIDLNSSAITLFGRTGGGTPDVNGSCARGSGPGIVYSFELEQDTKVLATVHGHDTVLSLRRSCEKSETELACDDDGLGGFDERGSRLSEELKAGRYFLIVESNYSKNSRYQLDLELETL